MQTATHHRALYQLIVNRLDGHSISSASYCRTIVELVKNGIGGFIIFGGVKEDIKAFIKELQGMSEQRLFIASDIERGVGQQIEGATHFPCQMAMAAAINMDAPDDVTLYKAAISAIAQESLDIGINMLLTPVLDVNTNPLNPIICTRAFSCDPAAVAWFGKVYIETLEAAGLISCAKHFPGHGDTEIDSHIALPVIGKTGVQLRESDFVPFAEAINAGVSSIMAAHIAIPAIDGAPASLSKTILSGILRDELSFDGLILTDALNMDALKDIEDVEAKCLNAGADILLHPFDAVETVEGLIKCLSRGRLDSDRVTASYQRILKAKHRPLTLLPLTLLNDMHDHSAISTRITEKSITLVPGSKSPFIPEPSKTLLIEAGESKFHGSSCLTQYFTNHMSLSARGISGDITGDISGLTLLVAIYTNISAWRGSSGIPQPEIDTIKTFIERAGRSAVISFGSPYLLSQFKESGFMIAAYEASKQASTAVLKCLKGQLQYEGRLPVVLPD
ncbi:glycoside hydrolase family 3 protein [Candidatus Magnetominusculus xianensis]|uniref:beta-N-acetylhexosaminidase n=1 Tax=Candidatus Magnetominusculus xianensis TaxID=1748249 RepID=A0ABR5SJT8_9BACT|nr:glycoside hydrolase family 3 N-terminal domain-containing protein [Candidatus Magnetominusculus xianensis]KWT95112.1 glycoside hydrolase family 3 [Candidatus Magnetominusculus xianensis]MBF0402759.1 hypothetical protein [Nitrospirota bacterium]